MFAALLGECRPQGKQTSSSLVAVPPLTAFGQTPAVVRSRPRPGSVAGRLSAVPGGESTSQLIDESIGWQVPFAETSAAVRPTITDEELLAWLAGAERQIRGHARKYLSHSPYDLEEFIQQAYEVALTAREAALRKGAPFEKVFWSSFRIACIHMTYTHGKRLGISHEEYREYGDEAGAAFQAPAELLTDVQEMSEAADTGPGTDPADGLRDWSLSPPQKMAATRQILVLMTPKERRAWEYHLAGRSRRQTARTMGVSRQCIQNLLRRGLKRAKRLAIPASLRPQAIRSPRRPRTVLRTASQHYLPIIEKLFFRKICSA